MLAPLRSDSCPARDHIVVCHHIAACGPLPCSSASMATATAASSGGLATCCYHVPPAALGRLIGPRGATIQQVQQSTGARIDTPKGDAPGSGDLPPGLVVVAAPTAEALEACRLAIEQIVGFAVSPHAPSRVLLDLRADSPLLGKLRADRYAIASRVRASCGLMELEVPGRDNSFECVAAVGTLDNCLAARDMLAAELQLGHLPHRVMRLGADADGARFAATPVASQPLRPHSLSSQQLSAAAAMASAATFTAPAIPQGGPERLQTFHFPDKAIGRPAG